MLNALAHAAEPRLALRARSLVFDPRIRTNERLRVLSTQTRHAELVTRREEVLAWVRQHEEAIIEAITLPRATGLLGSLRGFCSAAAADEIEVWLGGRIERFPGGPRRLAGVLERVRLCAARSEHQRASALEFFARREGASP
jgi:alanyl aminopeptidase